MDLHDLVLLVGLGVICLAWALDYLVSLLREGRRDRAASSYRVGRA